MASFATEVKDELARLMYDKPCCRMAELSALFRMRASISIAPQGYGASFAIEHAAIARKVITLLKGMEEGMRTEVRAIRTRRLRKRNSYTVRIAPAPQVERLLERLGLVREGSLYAAPDRSIFRHSCCRAAYLRGAFLGGGSVNRPESSNHLEIVTESHAMADFLANTLRRMDFPVGLTDRKEDYIVYLKEGDAIMDFLGMLQADKSVERFEVARNVKEVRNQVNRLVNCETANLQKAVDAAGRQMEDIRRLKGSGRFSALPEQLRETADMRMEHPDLPMAELAALLCVSKSGLNHRMRKLHQLAQADVALRGESVGRDSI